MDRKTATIIQDLFDAGFKKEAQNLIKAIQDKIASTMPRYSVHSTVALIQHNSNEIISGVVKEVKPRQITVSTEQGVQRYLWTGCIFEKDDDSRFSTPVAIIPEYGEM